MKKTISTFLLLLIVTIFSAQTNEQYVVSSSTLKVRTGAGKQYEVLATILQGATVTLIEKSDKNWWHVYSNGIEGYVYSPLLKKDPYSG